VHRRDVPGLAFACGLGDRVLLHEVGGVTALGPDPSAITEDTLFDLASLTKVVATTSAILALTDAGRLSLDEPLAVFEPDFRQGSKSKVTVRDLLRHTAGLPASRRYYLTCTTADEMRRRLRAEPLVADPGTTVLYSDLGFMLLGDLVEHITADTLDVACDKLVFTPLAMDASCFCPRDHPGTEGLSIAATEPDADGRWTFGVVHDRNARRLGGVAGHAGLFAALSDLVHFAIWWSGTEEGPICASGRQDAMRRQTFGLGGAYGLGWVCRGDTHDFLDDAWSVHAVTHTGFTGTSIAIDPERGWWACLLTNAVHLGRTRHRVKPLRKRVHLLAARLLAAAEREGRAGHALAPL
jgi:CubicO group peptidase (beta-lactamase class C family)